MRCGKCQFENLPGMKFCVECGAKLEIICPKCNSANSPDYKFCGQCGNNLASPERSCPPKDLSFDDKIAKIQKYLPSGLTEKILSQKDRIEGERRHVTIMFIDMKGFTPLTEMLGPEETFALMDGVFEIIIHKIHDYEGTVNELRGDGALALFGAPIALEDAPQRAVRSALAIHREMAKFNETIQNKSKIPAIFLRIGINSGPVVVGAVGNDLRVQFTAVGDTINMAARMEQIAEPGTTYVTEQTFRLTEGYFRFEALGERQIKGKKQPLKVYRVIAPNTRRTRFDVSTERGLTRFVGRARELQLLVDSFERAKAGRGQVVSIMGHAGVGKSRLLYEFRKALANEDILFLLGKCLSFGRGIPYHPVIDLLKANFGINEGDSDSTLAEKLKRGLALLNVDEASTLPYLLELLSVKHSGIDSVLMSPEAKKDRIFQTLQRIILKGSEARPLILAFEDLHWMDKSSEEAAKYLMGNIPGARVLMIFTYRPEFLHTWGHKSFHSQISLNRLSNPESLAMTEHLLGGEVASDLGELVLEKTEGVPFFIEEFIRTLREMEIIEMPSRAYHLGKDVDRVAIPSTIQDVVMARVDSLPDASKEVLQAGSAIEREFTYDLIRAVSGFSEQELLTHLSTLKNAELLYERGIFPQSTYVFMHSLTREVIYESILKNRRKMLHQKIGKAIEEIYRDRLDGYYSILSDHYMLSDDFQQSADYSRMTYERARRQGAITTAMSYGQKRIDALEHLSSTPQVQVELIDARSYHGLTLFVAGDLVGAKEAIEPIVEMTLKNKDQRQLAQISLILGSYQYAVQEDFVSAFERLREAVQNAEQAGDLAVAILSHIFLGLALCWDCKFEKGSEHIQKALWYNEAAQVLWGVSVTNSYLSYYAYNYEGKVREGLASSTKALEIAETSGDILSRAMAYVCHGISHYYKGSFRTAKEHLLKGVDLCERANLGSTSAIAHQSLGYVYYEMRDYTKSQSHYQEVIALRQRTGILPSCINLNKIALARAALASGQRDLDIPSLVQLPRANKLKLYSGIMARHLAEILFHLDEAHFDDANAWIQEAILSHEQLGMKWDLAMDYFVFAQLQELQGRIAAGNDSFSRSLSLFQECGAEGWCRKIRGRLRRRVTKNRSRLSVVRG